MDESTEKLAKAISAAATRLDFQIDYPKILLIATDVKENLKHIPLNQKLDAIKNGSLAKYGRVYKLSAHEIFYWIREHKKEINPKQSY